MGMKISELAQRITERKFHDWSQSVMHDCDFCNQWSLTVKHENGERICASCCDDEYTSKLEVANAALVEALEKAQQYAKERDEENQDLMLTIGRLRVEREGLEAIRAAAEKLVRCKGRYHSEHNYRALAALFGVNTPDLPPLEHENVHYADAAEMEIAALRQRIAELESRTVKLPEPFELAVLSGGSSYYYADEVDEALTAQGIKWEEA